MATVRLEEVTKRFGPDIVVNDVSFEVGDGEFLVLVGPSGCGKSTTLRMIAGLESVTSGRLFIGDRLVNDVPPSQRDIAMVFQSYALYPHMTVRENLGFALELRRLPAAQISDRVSRAAGMLGLEPLLDRRPRALSGGQRQRVAIGRAIVREPRAFLFDEPLSNLDAKMRVQMRREISSLQRRLGVTTVYVTHDQVEAMTMGDRIVVMHRGTIQQIDTPLGLYERPRNLFVAGFIGSPAMNLLEGTIEPGAGELEFRSTDGAIRLSLGTSPSNALAREAGMRVVAGIRPEALYREGTPLPPGRFARVTLALAAVEPLGNETLLYVGVPGCELTARVVPQQLPALGQPVELLVDLSRVHYFDADSGGRIGS